MKKEYFFIFIIVIFIVVGGIVIMQRKSDEKEVSNAIIENETDTEEVKLISGVTHIGIEIFDETIPHEEGIDYSDELIIQDREIINNFLNIVNQAQKYDDSESENGTGGYFEGDPIIIFYLENGKKISIIAQDSIDSDNNIFGLWNSDDASDKEIYKTDRKLAELITSTYHSYSNEKE